VFFRLSSGPARLACLSRAGKDRGAARDGGRGCPVTDIQNMGPFDFAQDYEPFQRQGRHGCGLDDRPPTAPRASENIFKLFLGRDTSFFFLSEASSGVLSAGTLLSRSILLVFSPLPGLSGMKRWAPWTHPGL
jgi:hypothetical protein